MECMLDPALTTAKNTTPFAFQHLVSTSPIPPDTSGLVSFSIFYFLTTPSSAPFLANVRVGSTAVRSSMHAISSPGRNGSEKGAKASLLAFSPMLQ